MYMKKVYCILLYIVTDTSGVWCTIFKNKNQNNKHNNKISGGNDAEIESYPHTVFMQLDNGDELSYCTGSIVTSKSVVTSARCLEGIKEIKLSTGSTYANTGGYEYFTTTFSQHPRFDNNTYDFDVGVITVEEGMELDGETTSAIRLPSITSDPPVGQYITITGWGATEAGQTEPNFVLQVAKVPVISRSDCRKKIRGITRRMFCADGDANICKGDYGGPAVGQQRVLDGISSFGPECGEGGPGVYTRVGEAMIRSYLKVQTGV